MRLMNSTLPLSLSVRKFSFSLLLIGSLIDLAPLTVALPSLRSETHISTFNSTKADNIIWCHKEFGQHLIAQLPDCARVLEVLRSRDIKNVGVEAVFSWDPATATKSKNNIYLLPQTIERGNCRARVELNGVKSVRALWDLDVWDSFGQLMADCVVKRGLGGATFAPRTGVGLRVILKGTNSDSEGIDPSNRAVMEESPRSPLGNISTVRSRNPQ